MTLQEKASLILFPRQCILTYNPQYLPLFKLEVIRVHSVTKTVKIFQGGFQQEMLDMMKSEGPLFQAETNIGPMFLLKCLMAIPMLSSLTLRPRVKTPPLKGLSRNDVLDGSESAEAQNTQEPSTRWGPGDSSNLGSGLEDANPSYPFLPTVLEEPGSSFSEAAEDDPLPGIEGLRITGEPFPGRELQAKSFNYY